MTPFDHEKLKVYQEAIAFVSIADEIVERLPRGRGYLADQLQRAATSISLNIAEGAGEFANMEKARFYRMAKRSATECAAIVDVAERLKLVDDEVATAARELLHPIVAMLVRMIQIHVGTDKGKGTGMDEGGVYQRKHVPRRTQ